MVNDGDENVHGGLPTEADQRPLWELRGYKTFYEIESEQEWERYIAEAEQDLGEARYLGRMLTWQRDKPAHETARIAAMRRRLARDLKASGLVELMLVDLLTANFQQQLDWWELRGTRTEVLRKRTAYGRSPREREAVLETDFTELSERVVPVLDRLNRQFLRTVKAYRDLKTSPITVNIQQAGQVNVGEHQVNVASDQLI